MTKNNLDSSGSMGNWIHLGKLALPASGLLSLVSSLAPEVFINPSVDPAGFAQAYGSTGFLTAGRQPQSFPQASGDRLLLRSHRLTENAAKGELVSALRG